MARSPDDAAEGGEPIGVRLRRAMATFRPLLPVSLGVFCVSMAVHFRTPVLAEMGEDLAMSAAQIGLVTTSFGFGRLAADLPAGFFNDRFDPRGMFLAAGVLMAGASLLFAGAPTPVWVLAAAFGLGTASAVSNTTGMAFFSTATASGRRGTAMAIYSASLLAGQAVGPALSGGVASAAGTWRASLLAAAVLAGLVIVVVAYHVLSSRRRQAHHGEPGDEAGAEAPHGGLPEEPPPDDPVHPLTRFQRWSLYVVPFSSMFTMSSIPQTLVPIIGSVDLGLSAGVIGTVLGVAGAARVAGSFIGGYVSDNRSRKGALLPGLLLQATGVGLIAVHGAGPWLAGILLFSIASFTGPIGATLLADGAGRRGAGKRFGGYRFVGDVGVITGPVLTGLAYEQLGAFGAVSPAVGLLILCAAWVGLVVPETRRNPR